MGDLFIEYVQNREIEKLIEAMKSENFDFDVFNEWVSLALNCQTDEEVNEAFWSTHGGGLTNLASAGLGAVGRGLGAVGRGIGNVASNVAQGAMNVAKGVGNIYMQGENKNQIKAAIDQVNNLRNSFNKIGIKNPRAYSVLDVLVKGLQHGLQNVQQDSSLRFGQPGIWRRSQNPQVQAVQP